MQADTTIRKFSEVEQLNHEAARLFVRHAAAAIAEHGHFTVAFTGGSSPAGCYRLLATPEYRNQVQWDRVYAFWGDERWVPLDDERSNARMTHETLLDHVPIPKDQIFPMWADETSPEEFARDYEQTLRRCLGPEGRFDLILLGMGGDGHTASWFPHTAVLHEQNKWVVGYYLDAQSMYRITLTVPVVNRAKHIAVITFGAAKANALYEVLEGERRFEEYPAQLLDNADGRVTWLVDDAAASRLNDNGQAG